jgi:hypothetical protein
MYKGGKMMISKLNQKIVVCVLVLTMCFGFLINVNAASSQFKYSALKDGTVKITKIIDTNNGEVVIPSKIDGKKVTVIGENAASELFITELTIPNSVKTIESGAFYYCDELSKITFEKNSQLVTIESVAFDNTNIKSITIPKSVKTIGSSAFSDCQKLEKVTFEKNSQLETIGNEAFFGADLKSITIPKSVKNIENYAFGYCQKLEKVTFEKNSQLTTIEENTFKSTNIKSITIPKSVKTLGSSVFDSCTQLEKVTFEKNSQLTTIKEGAFAGTAITSITIPDSVKKVEEGAFAGTAITSITIPDSVKKVEECAFKSCTKLKTIKIGKNVKTISAYMFYGGYETNKSLTSVTIPNTVTTIQYKAFANNVNLSKVTLSSNLKTVEGKAFDNTKWYKNQKNGSIYIQKTYYAYKGSMKKNTSISIKQGTTSIADFAFDGCKNLSSVTIPDSVKTIGEGAFANCTSLKSVYIPSSVTKIESVAFGFVFNYDWDNSDYFTANTGYKKVKGFTIYGVTGSAAEKYAKKHGVKFVAVPKAPSVTVSVAKKSATVKMKKVSGASGYEIAYRVKGTSKYKTVTTTSLTKKLTKLTSKKKYEIKVRAYKKVNGKKYYGEYSSVKTTSKIK